MIRVDTIEVRLARLVGTRGPSELPPPGYEIDAARRREAAQAKFRSLPVDVQTALIAAAKMSGLVFRSLNDGRWGATTRALLGLSLRSNNTTYRTLAEQVDRLAPNELSCM